MNVIMILLCSTQKSKMYQIMSSSLKLVLKKKWFDLIASGEKKEEYRDVTEYWRRRLQTTSNEPSLMWRRYDTVIFYLGYAKDRPSMTFKCNGIDYGKGREDWGAEPDTVYFVIKLGERV